MVVCVWPNGEHHADCLAHADAVVVEEAVAAVKEAVVVVEEAAVPVVAVEEAAEAVEAVAALVLPCLSLHQMDWAVAFAK